MLTVFFDKAIFHLNLCYLNNRAGILPNNVRVNVLTGIPRRWNAVLPWIRIQVEQYSESMLLVPLPIKNCNLFGGCPYNIIMRDWHIDPSQSG